MGARIGGNTPDGKSNRRRESEFGEQILQALRTSALGGPVKRLARKRRCSISAIYKILEGDSLSWLEEGQEWLEACEAEPGKSRADAHAPLQLLAALNRFQLVDLAEADGETDGMADELDALVREASDVLSDGIKAVQQTASGERLTAEQVESIRRNTQDVIQLCHRLVREAEAAGPQKPTAGLRGL